MGVERADPCGLIPPSPPVRELVSNKDSITRHTLTYGLPMDLILVSWNITPKAPSVTGPTQAPKR